MEIFQEQLLLILIAQLFWAIPGTGNGDSDHLVIGQSDDAENYPFYRN